MHVGRKTKGEDGELLDHQEFVVNERQKACSRAHMHTDTYKDNTIAHRRYYLAARRFLSAYIYTTYLHTYVDAYMHTCIGEIATPKCTLESHDCSDYIYSPDSNFSRPVKRPRCLPKVCRQRRVVELIEIH